jgi:hypothetical protein
LQVKDKFETLLQEEDEPHISAVKTPYFPKNNPTPSFEKFGFYSLNSLGD